MTNANRAINLTVNGKEYQSSVEVRKTLADFLRDELDLTGTHLGCEHGVCGACTILFNGDAVRSCLMLAVQADGADLTTVEGLAQGDDLNALQRAFQENGCVPAHGTPSAPAPRIGEAHFRKLRKDERSGVLGES